MPMSTQSESPANTFAVPESDGGAKMNKRLFQGADCTPLNGHLWVVTASSRPTRVLTAFIHSPIDHEARLFASEHES